MRATAPKSRVEVLERRVSVSALQLFHHDCECNEDACWQDDGCPERIRIMDEHNDAVNDLDDFYTEAAKLLTPEGVA